MGAFRRGFRNRNPLVLVAAALLLVPALLGFQWLFTSGAGRSVPLDVALRNRRGLVHVHLLDGRQGAAGPAGHAGAVPARRLERARVDRERRRARRRDRRTRRASRRRLRPRLDQPELRPEPDRGGQRAGHAGLAAGRHQPRPLHGDQGAERRPGGGPRAAARERRRPGLRLLRVGPPGVLVHDPAGHLGVHHRLDARSTAASCSRATRRAPSTSCTGTRRRPGARTARRSGSSRSGTRAASRSSSRTWTPTCRCSRRCWRRPASAASTSCCSSCRSTRRSSATASPLAAAVPDAGHGAGPRVRRALRRLQRDVDIPSRDFQDLSHLIAPGRVIWQHALAKELAPLLSKDSGGSSG